MLFDLIKDKGERINPTKTLDTEKYFESLIIWKKITKNGICEKDQNLKDGHKKILGTAKPLRRQFLGGIFYFLELI